MTGNIMTVVEGSVPEERWQDLQEAFKGILQSPPEGILQSFITQEKSEPTLWRLMTLWENMEVLKEMQQSHSVPAGIKIFRDIDVEPAVRIFEVKISLNDSAGGE